MVLLKHEGVPNEYIITLKKKYDWRKHKSRI